MINTGNCANEPHLPDAVAHPGAVVVELADAVVADGAVRAARRPVVVAGDAPFGAHHKPIHLILLCFWPRAAPHISAQIS